MRNSKRVTSIQHETTRSVRRTSKGVGFSPAISSRIMSRRPESASWVSGSPAEAARMSMCCALRPTSEALATTPGEASLSLRLSSLFASLSPPSALLERLRNSSRLSRTSAGIRCLSSAPRLASGTSPLSLVSMVAGCYQVGPDEDLRGLRQLEDRGDQGLQAFELRLLSLTLCFR